VTDAANAGVRLLNERSNSVYSLVMTTIVSAKRQVVGGHKYTIIVKAGFSTQCRNDGSNHTLAECPVANPSKYTLVVLDRPWMTPRYVLLSHHQHACLGCTTPVSVDQNARQAATEGMFILNSDNATKYHLQMIRILHVSRQVVQGLLYTFTVRGGPSMCLNKNIDESLETKLIDTWLSVNKDTLNQFGDPAGSVYTGGSPLFDETTGKYQDVQQYVTRQHRDRPWCTVAAEDQVKFDFTVHDRQWLTPRYSVKMSKALLAVAHRVPSSIASKQVKAVPSQDASSTPDESNNKNLGYELVAAAVVVVIAIGALALALWRSRPSACGGGVKGNDAKLSLEEKTELVSTGSEAQDQV